MSDHPFLRFIDLVNFDQKLHSLENEKNSNIAEINALKKQEEEQAHHLEDMNKRVFQAKKRVDEQELEMKVLDQKEKDKKKKLENLSDYKEYQAIKAELETIHQAQVAHEKIILDAWHHLEQAEHAAQKKALEHTEYVQQLHEKQAALDQKSLQLDDQIAQLIEQRKEKEAGVPAEWLEKYTIMRARVPDPVVEIYHQSCSSCSQMITQQEMVRARKGALVQCQTCYRLLYAPEIMEKHEAA